MTSMNLTAANLTEPGGQSWSLSERAQHLCRLAKQLEKSGEYQEAYEAISDFWSEPDGPPRLEGLDPGARAQVLLRIGSLAGRLGSVNQTGGSQERAKNLITESIGIFAECGMSEGIAEARADLALCYWREGSFDEAQINLAAALETLKDQNSELKAVVLIRAGLVEVDARRLNEAWRLYNEAAPLLAETDDHALKGTFHNSFGLVLRSLAVTDQREDYIDRALIEYAAASYHFEQAGHTSYCARVENNLGYLFFTLNRFQEAYIHLDRARRVCSDVGDLGLAAQIDDTRARALMAEGRLNEAERSALAAVKTLDRGGEQSLLAEALTTLGTVLARLGKIGRARASLQRAVEVARTTGDLEGEGRARLSIIEELGQQISVEEVASTYRAALDLLQNSQNPASAKRLISCAQKVIGALDPTSNRKTEADANGTNWEGFSFKKEVLAYEKEILARALRETGGAVTKAARLLGFNHHQSLIALINSRHQGLVGLRAPARTRRQSIIKKGKNKGKKRPRTAVKA